MEKSKCEESHVKIVFFVEGERSEENAVGFLA